MVEEGPFSFGNISVFIHVVGVLTLHADKVFANVRIHLAANVVASVSIQAGGHFLGHVNVCHEPFPI